MEYYFETLGNDHDTLFPIVEKYLENCPVCVMEKRLALYREAVSALDARGALVPLLSADGDEPLPAGRGV